MSNVNLDNLIVGTTSVEIVIGDMATQDVDALVSSDDSDLTMSGGVSKALRLAGGVEVHNEARQSAGKVKPGQVVVTGAGSLHAKYVLHAITIDFPTKTFPNAEIIRSVTHAALAEADRLKCHSISLPAFGTGTGGYSREQAAVDMIAATVDYLSQPTGLHLVRFVLHDANTFAVFFKKTVLRQVEQREAYIDELKDKIEQLEQELGAVRAPDSRLADFPYSIAFPLAWIDSVHEPLNRYFRLNTSVEAILRTLVYIGMSEQLRLKMLTPDEQIAALGSKRSLGKWMSDCREIYGKLRPHQNELVVPDALSFVLDGKGKPSASMRLLDELIKYRNQNQGHPRTVGDDDYYTNLLDATRAKLDEVVENLGFLANYPMIFVGDVDFDEDERFRYGIRYIRGSSVAFLAKTIVSDQKLKRGILYLQDPAKDRFLPLGILIKLHSCETCMMPDLFLLEEANEAVLTYQHSSWCKAPLFVRQG